MDIFLISLGTRQLQPALFQGWICCRISVRGCGLITPGVPAGLCSIGLVNYFNSSYSNLAISCTACITNSKGYRSRIDINHSSRGHI